MEPPAHVVEALKGIREGLHLKWNPFAVVVKYGHYDVSGRATEPVFDGRWELWDVDPQGCLYKVMTLQDPEGGYRPPGEWVVDLVNMVNPARYGGDVSRMTKAMVDDPNQTILDVNDKDFDDLVTQAVKWVRYRDQTKQTVLTNLRD